MESLAASFCSVVATHWEISVAVCHRNSVVSVVVSGRFLFLKGRPGPGKTPLKDRSPSRRPASLCFCFVARNRTRPASLWSY